MSYNVIQYNINQIVNASESRCSGNVCRIGTNYYGCVGYADNLKLRCPGLKGIQRMPNICTTFSGSNGLIFNANKTMCIQFHYGKNSGEIPQYSVYLGLDKLQWYSQVKHLGHIFNYCSSFSTDVANRKGQFIGCVNSIITQFWFCTSSL